MSANYLWLVTNSKLCPNANCNTPIQKNEGCNHIKCYRCKHDFCWICMEPWKKHSSATGGYFQCNRYEVSSKVGQKEKETVAQAEEVYNKAAELNKFVHYYTRFKNHENSYKIEEPLLQMAKTKFDMLVAQQQSSSIPGLLAQNTGLVDEVTGSNLNLQARQSVEESSMRNVLNGHGFVRHASFSSPLSPLLHSSSLSSGSNTPKMSDRNNKDNNHPSTNTNNSKHQNGNHHHHSSSMVKRMSNTIEKSVSKILHHQDWAILHERAGISTTVSSPDTKPSNRNNRYSTSLEKLSSESFFTPPVKRTLHANSVQEMDEEEQMLQHLSPVNSDELNINAEEKTNSEPMLVDNDDSQRIQKQNVESTSSKAAAEETSLSVSGGSKKTRSDEPHFFIEEAIRELLRSRRILRCSYVYGYYLDTFGHKKFIFELVQTEFEECTENLSQVIARPHLKTPKNKIIRLTNMLKKKRVEFLDTITRGLNSFNDTPPTLKKYSRQRWKYLLKDNIQNEDEFKNTIALSIRELNPKNPWIIDKKGRHTNLLALLNDWPELEQDLESILTPSKEKNGLCAKWDCGNVRAVNTLSGLVCNYCSIRCLKLDHNAYMEQKKISEQQQLLLAQQQMRNSSIKLNSALEAAIESRAASIAAKKSASTTPCSGESPPSVSGDVTTTVMAAMIKGGSGSSTSSSFDSRSSRFEKINGQNGNTKTATVLTTSNAVGHEKTNYEDEFDDFFDMGFRDADAGSAQNEKGDQFEMLKQAIEMSKIDILAESKDGQNGPTRVHVSTIFSGHSRQHLEQQSERPSFSQQASTTSAIIGVSNLPYEPLYVTANENDISTILKNIKNVIYDDASLVDKTVKVCNFQVKSKPALAIEDSNEVD